VHAFLDTYTFVNAPVVHHEFFSKGVGNCFLAIIADIVEINRYKR
jgi:hypothetical protein